MQAARTAPPPLSPTCTSSQREGGRDGRRETVSESQLSGGERNLNRKTASVKTRKTLLQGGKFPLNRQRR